MADTDVRRISGLESSEAIGKWPVDKPEDNTADFIKPILKSRKVQYLFLHNLPEKRK